MNKKGYERKGNITFDLSRIRRTSLPEIIFGQNKSLDQLINLIKLSLKHHKSALVTRIEPKTAKTLKKNFPGGKYNEKGCCFCIPSRAKKRRTSTSIAVLTAGASDETVAEEASCILEFLGWNVIKIYDVGVAGIHRLLDRTNEINSSSVVIVIAGMEGALASVVAGLTDKPVIGVPTSVGYGANMGGVAPLLTMLNSCAGGVTVVNIDGGFNAACAAHKICLITEKNDSRV